MTDRARTALSGSVRVRVGLARSAICARDTPGVGVRAWLARRALGTGVLIQVSESRNTRHAFRAASRRAVPAHLVGAARRGRVAVVIVPTTGAVGTRDLSGSGVLADVTCGTRRGWILVGVGEADSARATVRRGSGCVSAQVARDARRQRVAVVVSRSGRALRSRQITVAQNATPQGLAGPGVYFAAASEIVRPVNARTVHTRLGQAVIDVYCAASSRKSDRARARELCGEAVRCAATTGAVSVGNSTIIVCAAPAVRLELKLNGFTLSTGPIRHVICVTRVGIRRAR